MISPVSYVNDIARVSQIENFMSINGEYGRNFQNRPDKPECFY